MMSKFAICGASGMVGRETLDLLISEKIITSLSEVSLFVSERSAGQTISTPLGEMTFQLLDPSKIRDFFVVFICVSGSFSAKHAPIFAENNKYIIDNSSYFRQDPNIPLVIPEINRNEISKSTKIIANPNCTTAILLMATAPLHRVFGIKKMIISTYQATSGGGRAAMDELTQQTQNYLEGEEVTCESFQYPIPFNLIPHIDSFQGNGYTKEEMKVTWETRKILNEPNMPISCTSVRIPTFRTHAEAVTIETEKEISPKKSREILSSASGIDLVDNLENNQYPMPLTATKKHNVEVGRIRQSLVFGNYGIDFFVAGDQLLRGAALNAVKISQHLISL